MLYTYTNIKNVKWVEHCWSLLFWYYQTKLKKKLIKLIIKLIDLLIKNYSTNFARFLSWS